jgi:hypothetical protein
MLNSLSSRPHSVGFLIEAFLHRFKAGFIFPASNAPIGVVWGGRKISEKAAGIQLANQQLRERTPSAYVAASRWRSKVPDKNSGVIT